nr:10222_t:CDS:2 [Entrophospora candida]
MTITSHKKNIDETLSGDASQILSSSISGASSLVLLQLVSRLSTFILNQIVLRYTDPATFGIASVQLELLLATILFLSREGFRCALLRVGGGDDSEIIDNDDNEKETGKSGDLKKIIANSNKGAIQKVTNLSYIPIPIGIITSFMACLFYIYYATEETKEAPYYVTSVILYGLSAFGELIIEPLYILAMNKLIFKLRVGCEGVGVIVRCIITLSLTILGAPDDKGKAQNEYGILAFAIAQFAFTLVLIIGYIGYFIYSGEIKLLVPRKIIDQRQKKEYWFDEHFFNLSKTFTKQSLLKHVLTEGDKMLITWLSNPNDQGIYAIVVNYGSLIVRILFQPVEETGRTLFSKLLSDSGDDDDIKNKRSIKNYKIFYALDILLIIIKFHIFLGLFFIGFATNYTGTLIDLLIGPSWSNLSTPLVLSVYCLYIPIMGINGITEAFVAAVATEETLKILNYWLILFSAGFVGAGIFFMKILSTGAVGLIFANMFNLSMRIIWSWNFIRNYFLNKCESNEEKNLIQQKLSIFNILPNSSVILSFIISWFITYLSNLYIGWDTFEAKIKHISVGLTFMNVVIGIIYLKEKKYIEDVLKLADVKRKGSLKIE